MGRASGHRTAVSGFDAVMGARRGSGGLDLTAPAPTPATLAYVSGLRDQAFAGDLAPGLSELRRPAHRGAGSPLLDTLVGVVLRAAANAGTLHSTERRELHASLGLTGPPSPAAASPRDTLAAVAAVLPACVQDEDDRCGRALVHAARAAHLRAFASGLAHDAAASPGVTLRDAFGADGLQELFELTRAERLLSPAMRENPGMLAPTPLGLTTVLGAQLTVPDWRDAFERALLTADPPAGRGALCAALTEKLAAVPAP